MQTKQQYRIVIQKLITNATIFSSRNENIKKVSVKYSEIIVMGIPSSINKQKHRYFKKFLKFSQRRKCTT